MLTRRAQGYKSFLLWLWSLAPPEVRAVGGGGGGGGGGESYNIIPPLFFSLGGGFRVA